jgi:hypothetical protein
LTNLGVRQQWSILFFTHVMVVLIFVSSCLCFVGICWSSFLHSHLCFVGVHSCFLLFTFAFSNSLLLACVLQMFFLASSQSCFVIVHSYLSLFILTFYSHPYFLWLAYTIYWCSFSFILGLYFNHCCILVNYQTHKWNCWNSNVTIVFEYQCDLLIILNTFLLCTTIGV